LNGFIKGVNASRAMSRRTHTHRTRRSHLSEFSFEWHVPIYFLDNPIGEYLAEGGDDRGIHRNYVGIDHSRVFDVDDVLA
jgi:hypothetical protein